MGMNTVCILGVSIDDAVSMSHELVISGENLSYATTIPKRT